MTTPGLLLIAGEQVVGWKAGSEVEQQVDEKYESLETWWNRATSNGSLAVLAKGRGQQETASKP